MVDLIIAGANNDALPQISIVIPTLDRPKDLVELLRSILHQSCIPFEVIIVDESRLGSARHASASFNSEFRSAGCRLKYARGSGNGSPAARNLGVGISEGDAILFLDDDALLDKNVVEALAIFLKDHPRVLGVQPKILAPTGPMTKGRLGEKLENIISKALMLTYREENRLEVRRSGMSVLPNRLTSVIVSQRLSGCGCCFRRRIFNKLAFDTNLKRWGFMEDLDFSYRVYRGNPKSLYAIPYAMIVHKESAESRLARKSEIYMTTVYWFYVFFKDVFETSIRNLIAFLWALTGSLIAIATGLVIKRKPKQEWWRLIYMLGSYSMALRNLKNVLMRRLEFLNANLK